jgi:tryptophan synthase alpha chain
MNENRMSGIIDSDVRGEKSVYKDGIYANVMKENDADIGSERVDGSGYEDKVNMDMKQKPYSGIEVLKRVFNRNEVEREENPASGKALITFLTAGDPDSESTVNYILEMEKAGADLIEIGIPFSDPTAEGPVIQNANIRALQGGMTTDGVFDIAKRVRERSQVPLAVMTYLNPVFHYGYDRFFAKCEEVGIAGIIIPDLPYEEREEVAVPAVAHHVALISMIAPTSEERIAKIAASAQGFLYVVSDLGVTGQRREIHTNIAFMIEQIRKVSDIPCAIGFGISTPSQAAEMAAVADGCIVGSAIVQIIGEEGRNAGERLGAFIHSLKEGMLERSIYTK